MGYQEFKESRKHNQLLKDVDTLGSFDFNNAIITMDSLLPEDIESLRTALGGAFVSPFLLKNLLSADQYAHIAKVLPLAIHEYTHFLDSTSTLWGLTHLMLMNRGYSSNPIFGETENNFLHAKAFFDHCRRIRLPKYYTTINDRANDSRPWMSTISAGYLFDSNGRVTANPIIFSNFKNSNGEHLARSPVSTVSLLEASAMAQEVIFHLSLILATEGDFKTVELKIFSESTVAYLYKKTITEYSVCAHILANKLGFTNVFEAFMLCAGVVRIVLNFSQESFRRIARRCPVLEILKNNQIEAIPDRLILGLKSGDLGTLFYLICLAIPNRSYKTETDVKTGISQALEYIGLDYPTFVVLRDKRADELLAELAESPFKSIRQLSKAGRANMKLVDQEVVLDYFRLNLPPAWLNDGSFAQIFDHGENLLKSFDLDQCFEELFKGESWIERFSEGCL